MIFNSFCQDINMESDIQANAFPRKSSSRIIGATLSRWEKNSKKVELYIPSFDDGDSLKLHAVGKLTFQVGKHGDMGYFVVSAMSKSAWGEPIEKGDYMRLAETYVGAPIRPVDYEPLKI